MFGLIAGLSIGVILGITIPIVVIAVLVILYFCFFREGIEKSIKESAEKRKNAKAEAEAQKARESSIVDDVFAKRDKMEAAKHQAVVRDEKTDNELDILIQQQKGRMISERNIQQQNANLNKSNKEDK